jgi:hypothetical protein
MRGSLIAAVLVATTGVVSTASADPVRVTGGVLSGSDSSVNDFSIFGSGFTLSGIVSSDAVGEPHWRCGPCQAGDQLSLGSRYIIDGVEFNGSVDEDATGFFDFAAETITIPDLTPGDRALIQRSFTFAGEVSKAGSSGTLAIVGSGSVLLNLIGRDAEDGLPAHVDATQTRYEFSDSAAAPVPEPMTLLLVAQDQGLPYAQPAALIRSATRTTSIISLTACTRTMCAPSSTLAVTAAAVPQSRSAGLRAPVARVMKDFREGPAHAAGDGRLDARRQLRPHVIDDAAVERGAVHVA